MILLISTFLPSRSIILSFLNSLKVRIKLSFVVPASSASSLRVNGNSKSSFLYMISAKYNITSDILYSDLTYKQICVKNNVKYQTLISWVKKGQLPKRKTIKERKRSETNQY